MLRGDAIGSSGPAADLAEQMGLYGWLIGDWAMEATVHANDSPLYKSRGSIHFGWVRTYGFSRDFSMERRCESMIPAGRLTYNLERSGKAAFFSADWPGSRGGHHSRGTQ